MAEGSSRRKSPRRVGSQDLLADGQPGRPKNVIELIDTILGDFRRTSHLVWILCALAVLLYTATALIKGVHFLTLPVLVPGGVIVGPSVTYWTIRAGWKWVRRASTPAELPAGQDAQPASAETDK
jgi:hypothetical protein